MTSVIAAAISILGTILIAIAFPLREVNQQDNQYYKSQNNCDYSNVSFLDHAMMFGEIIFKDIVTALITKEK